MLTIAKLKRWSINYYIDTAQTAKQAANDLARAGGGLGEYYSERETRTPVWLLAGDTNAVATLIGLTDAQRAGGEADDELSAAAERLRQAGIEHGEVKELANFNNAILSFSDPDGIHLELSAPL